MGPAAVREAWATNRARCLSARTVAGRADARAPAGRAE